MRIRLVVMSLALLACAALPAAAQQRVPDAGTWAAGGAIGLSGSRDPSLNGGLALSGSIENYLTPRLSARVQVGGAWWDIVGRHFGGTVAPVYFTGNAVYNWEGGKVHPFVTGGIGVYLRRSSETQTQNATDTAIGADFGGGAEYFVRRHDAVTGEFLYHAVGAIQTPLATFDNGSFWTLTFGITHDFR
ncbi:MAG TPA: outer membrane beta-barrel protein [Vicinamibacterales bacterium]|jgi:hypothetical protein